MCGIAGFAGPGGRGDLERMTARLTHRGPDADGFRVDETDRVHLGHRRLSILDLAGGAQPMFTSDGQTGIVFNGEIYNFRELREELAAEGAVFFTDHSDTEVLLQAYRRWGEEMVGRLNGMWAFVIHDRARRRLFASRDRFGKKPFYYHHAPAAGLFAFASELTALLAHPVVPRETDPLAVRKYFAYGYVPAPLAMTCGSRKLPGGHNLRLDLPSGDLRVWRWWDFQPQPWEGPLPPDPVAEWGERLRELLAAAVRRRMVADVPLGVFLSGGLDSSTVAALAARELPAGALQTFSIGFEEKTFDESAHAARMAARLGSDHAVEVLSLDRARRLLPEIYARLDEPNGDASILPTYLLSRFTRQGVTVALGGDGGDELFAGYEPFRALQAARWYRRLLPRALHPAVAAMVDRLPVGHGYMSFDFALKRFVRGAARQPPLWIPTWMQGVDAAGLAEITGAPVDPEEVFSEAIEAWDGITSPDLVDKATGFFIRLYLQDSVLAKVDRASMLNSLEVRAPFLDLGVVDFVRRLPSAWKLRGWTSKYLLKEAVRPLLPAEIIDRPKKGFGVPVGAWFRDGHLDPVCPQAPGADLARRLLEAHRAGKADHRLLLWNHWVFGQWQKAVG